MMTPKTAKTLANSLYALGLAVFLVLAGFALFGAGLVPNPGAMISWSMREIAFVGLAFGAVPMLLACMAVYRCNGFTHSKHKRRNFFLIFAPGLLCGACLLFVLGLLGFMMMQALLHIASNTN